MKYILKTEVIENCEYSKMGVLQQRIFAPGDEGVYDRLDELLRRRSAEVSEALCKLIMEGEECLHFDDAEKLSGLKEDDIRTLMMFGLLLEDDMVNPEDLLQLINSRLQVVTVA